MAVHVEHHQIDLEERFIPSSKLKSGIFTAIGIGIVLFAIGLYLLITSSGHGHEIADAHTHGHEGGHGAGHAFHWTQHLFATLWINNVFFTGIAIVGVFFCAVQYVAYAGWSSSIIRIPQSFGYFLPVAAVLVIGTFAFGYHDLFHWTHEGITDVNSPNYDKIIAGKSGYLNLPFYWIRMVLYFTLWILVFFKLRSLSVQEDEIGGVNNYDRSIVWGAVFLLVFGVTSSTSAWDWVMSIDTHWFSTMFGWYVFASWHISGLAAITLTVILLKEQGYLKIVNENHLHDLGKFMFAFSIFWTYIWFSQFLLIFYANIPEETTYFIDRLHRFNGIYRGLFFANIFINFVFPFLALMTREAKRLTIFLKIVSIGLLLGHWLDFYLMVTPGVTKGNSSIGFLEIGSILIYAGLFIWVVIFGLSKARLIPKNHPMLEESIHHNI